MNLTVLVNELEERRKLVAKIDQIISEQVVAAPKKQLRRGLVQLLVIKELGVSRTSHLCAMINDRMERKGFACNILHGYQYYNNIAFK